MKNILALLIFSISYYSNAHIEQYNTQHPSTNNFNANGYYVSLGYGSYVAAGVFDNCDLSNLNLRYANLSNRSFRNANFTGTDLRDANFTGSDFSGALFNSTHIDGADFTSTIMSGTIFTNMYAYTWNIEDGPIFSNAYFSASTINNSVFHGTDFSFVRFYGTSISNSILGNCNFDNAEINTSTIFHNISSSDISGEIESSRYSLIANRFLDIDSVESISQKDQLIEGLQTTNALLISQINDLISSNENLSTRISSLNVLPQYTNQIDGHVYAGFTDENFVITWNTENMIKYVIESSTDLTNWINVGKPLIGTGEQMSWGNFITNSQSYYRVIQK